MPDDRVLFEVGGEPWTLSFVCLLLALASFVLAAILFTLVVRRHGKIRRLTGAEASSVAFNADKLGEVRSIHGPARGVEARVRFTIGDLRRAHQAGDHLLFWGGPAMAVSWCGGFGLLSLSGALATGEAMMLIGYTLLIPMLLIFCFMPWAAVYTKLE